MRRPEIVQKIRKVFIMQKPIFSLLLPLLSSCHNPDRARIDRAEQMLDQRPDSALVLLEQIDRPERLEDALKARYWLAVAEAHHSLNLAMTEDSMVRFACDYYRTAVPQDTARLYRSERRLAGYLWWKGEKEEAYRLLEEQLERSRREKNEAERARLLFLLSDYAAADNRFRESRDRLEEFLSLTDEKEHLMMFYNTLGILCFYLNDEQGFRRAFDTIPALARTQADSLFLWEYAQRNYADLLSDLGRQEPAIALQEEVLRHTGDKSIRMQSYASLSRCYLSKGDKERARHYFHLADSLSATASLSNADRNYLLLQRLATGYAQSGLLKISDFMLLNNNWQDETDRAEKIDQARQHTNRLLAERNLRLEIARQRSRMQLMALAFVCLIIIASSLLYIRRKRRLQAEKEEEVETLRRLLGDAVKSNEKDDNFFKRIVLQQLGIIRLVATNPTAANQQLLQRMRQITDKEVDVDALLDWNDLYRTIDYLYDGFHTLVTTRHASVLNEKEIQLCCLLRANFSTKEISTVTQQSVRTIYQRKSVIRQKLKMGEKEDIVEFLA